MPPLHYLNILESLFVSLYGAIRSPQRILERISPASSLFLPWPEEAAGRWEQSPAINTRGALRYTPVTKLRGRWVVGWASLWPKLPSQISGNSTCSICTAFPECPLPSVLFICHYLNTSTVQKDKADLLSGKQAQIEHFTTSLIYALKTLNSPWQPS